MAPSTARNLETTNLVGTPTQPAVRRRRNLTSAPPPEQPPPVVARGTEAPHLALWNRASMAKVLRLAHDVRVRVSQLGPEATVSIKKSELEAMIRNAPEDALFTPPVVTVTGDHQIVVVTFR